MQDLKIVGIQSDMFWESVDQNIQLFDSKIRSISEPVDLIILPETFNTGFTMNTDLAEDMNGKTVNWMKEIAKEIQSCVIGSVIIKENNKYFNRIICALTDGEILTYNKRHLFTFGEEDKYFTAGKERLIFNLKGWNVCPLICYDLRFPVWSRNNQHIDLYVFIANWPAIRSNAWDILLQARAVENVSYVVGINRIGEDATNKTYGGNSAVIDFKGDYVFQYPLNKNHLEVSNLSQEKLIQFRNKFPALNDGDNFEIKE